LQNRAKGTAISVNNSTVIASDTLDEVNKIISLHLYSYFAALASIFSYFCFSYISWKDVQKSKKHSKALLVASLTHVRGAVASTRPLHLPLVLMVCSELAQVMGGRQVAITWLLLAALRLLLSRLSDDDINIATAHCSVSTSAAASDILAQGRCAKPSSDITCHWRRGCSATAARC